MKRSLMIVGVGGLAAGLCVGASAFGAGTARGAGWCGTQPDGAGRVAAQASPRIDVVFVLDTTGSMGGLIEGAKRKIWSIANAVATAEPKPAIRMGLVGYRDVGDEYVTKLTPLTDDLDAVYEALMGFNAGGGGDGPESVNQALHEAVTRFDWAEGDEPLRLIYLVGDAPPHMDYEQDVKYPETCRAAAERGIIINTIQCGTYAEATAVWQEIARRAEGEYVAIDQSGGMTVVATPYDEELARLGREVDGTLLAYGSAEEQAAQRVRQERSERLAAAAPAAGAEADRVAYKMGEAGLSTLVGSQELVQDVRDGRVDLGKLSEDELPEALRELSPEERRAYVEKKGAERDELRRRIVEISAKRQAFLEEQMAAAGPDGFDRRVLEALRKQAAVKGIVYPPAP